MGLTALKVQMILPTGKRKKNRPGFTLIELVLVTVIILAIVAISTPQFKRTYDDLKLTTSVKEMAAILRFLRERTVFERKNYTLVIDINNRSYRAFIKDKDEELKTLKSKWGRNFKLSDNIDIETESEEIEFSPDGGATAALLYLTNKENSTQTIIIEETGHIRVYDYKKE